MADRAQTLAAYYHLADLAQFAGTVKAGDTIPVPLFPIGNWKSAKYPDLPLTRELAETIIANFEAGVLGTEPVIDSSGVHDARTPASAWVKRLSIEPTADGGELLIAWSQLTDLGAADLANARYRYASVEIGPHVRNDTGERVANVLKGATFTNTPVLRLMPAVLDTPEAIAAAEIVVALSEISPPEADPVATLVDEIDGLLGRLSDALKGKAGIPAIRTMLREVRAKASVHALDETDPPASPQKETTRMSKLTEFLKLAEDADEPAILAEVKSIAGENASLKTSLAERERAERVRKLGESIAAGHILPAEKEALLSLAEAAPQTFDATLAARQGVKVIDLAERGSGKTPDAEAERKPAALELAEKAAILAEKEGIGLAEATSKVIAAEPNLGERYLAETMSREVG
jgi:hypothetical protein